MKGTEKARGIGRYIALDLHEEVPQDGIAGFALTAHANGNANKNTIFWKAIKPEIRRLFRSSQSRWNSLSIHSDPPPLHPLQIQRNSKT